MQHVKSQCLVKQNQLEMMLGVCEQLGVEITSWHPNGYYFTVVCKEEWDDGIHIPAREIQDDIKAMAARYPDIVCFSLDCYCTLIYIV